MSALSNKVIAFVEPAEGPTEHVAPSNEFNVWYEGDIKPTRKVIKQGLDAFAKENGLVVINNSNTIAINPNATFTIASLPDSSEYKHRFSAEISFANGKRVFFTLDAKTLRKMIGIPDMRSARAGSTARVSSGTPPDKFKK